MKRTVPLLITAIVGFVLIVSFFIPAYQNWGENTAVWFDILASIAFVLGGGNLMKVHLKKISDRQRGWGYSAVTIIAFLATLFIGLVKLGTMPGANTEFYGESFTPLPLSALPEFRVQGTIPERADGEELPDSVRVQMRQEEGEVVFRGWMRPNQKSDLEGYEDTLEWQCLLERLAELARPPEALREELTYYADHGALGFRGYMSQEDRAALEGIFTDSEVGQQAVARLYEAATDETTITVDDIPESFTIPESHADQVSVSDGRLTVAGPVTAELRDEMARKWPAFPPVRPLTDDQQRELIAEIASRGPELTEEQRQAVSTAVGAVWSVELLRQTLDSAGGPQVVPVPACEMLEQMQAGVEEIQTTRTVGEEMTLNDAQVAALRDFAGDPTMPVDELVESLRSAGEFTDPQQRELEEFLLEVPTLAEWRSDLYFELLAAGRETGAGLSEEQQQYLLSDFRAQYAWRQAVSRLFLAAHNTKYEWSGNYAGPGSPFWWIYAYVFQPLTATMFAMLAFYVASAAFRAFRAKNLEAILLLGTAFIILLGRTFAGVLLTAWLPDWLSALKIDQMTVYIMSLFNTAGNRAIMIGIALGIASTSLKVLLGVDRSYLGSGEE